MCDFKLVTFKDVRREGRNFLYLMTHSTHFYLRLYGVIHMAKYHSDSEGERGNPLLSLYGLLFSISGKGSFICTIPQSQSWSTGWNKNSSVGPPWGIDSTTHRTRSRRSTTELHHSPFQARALSLSLSLSLSHTHTHTHIYIYSPIYIIVSHKSAQITLCYFRKQAFGCGL